MGDIILISGELGKASLGLAHLQQRVELPGNLREECVTALNRPTPRLELADFLASYASAAIDISDGLVGDLGHILESSQVGAVIHQADLPVMDWIKDNNAYEYALGGGDDYEICCTLPEKYRDRVGEWNQSHLECPLFEIGKITESDFTLIKDDQSTDLKNWQGYQHF